jgi:hypothetical protein
MNSGEKGCGENEQAQAIVNKVINTKAPWNVAFILV